jgi:hypothetical protein
MHSTDTDIMAVYGLGDQTFSYDNRSLQAAITREMERNGWVGVCCEPNVVFIVCNQFPVCHSISIDEILSLTNAQLIAIKYNDGRDGTHKMDDILAQYRAAWDKKGMVAPDGLFVDFWMVKQDFIVPPRDIGWTAWYAYHPPVFT